jgi:hypothetical protein
MKRARLAQDIKVKTGGTGPENVASERGVREPSGCTAVNTAGRLRLRL